MSLGYELNGLLSALKTKRTVDYKVVCDFFRADMTWMDHRKRLVRSTHHAFSPSQASSNKGADHFKAMASEILQMYPLMMHFMEKFSDVACIEAELRSFRAVCAVADAVCDMRM